MLRLIELFSGIGAQAKALKNLNIPFEHWRTCEWEINAMKSYKAIHSIYNVDYSEKYSKEELIEILCNANISNNGKEPMQHSTIKHKNEKWLREVYNAIVCTNNMTDITKVHGIDLGIIDKEKYTYIMTYSFPCQDLSIAGKQKGMIKGGGTRSGLLWEVERILKECEELNALPQVLLMENVTQVHGKKNIEDFKKWTDMLESLGYSNYCQDLNAKDYGIPQNRNRCFMVSILGNCKYEFPKSFELKLKLKDMLEDKVDEKYYLNDKQVKRIRESTYNTAKNRIQQKDWCNTLCARDYKDPKCVEAFDSKIRKLTPKEYWRLMGFSDEDFNKAEKICSNTQLYKQAGNSIVVNVLEEIFKNLFKSVESR